MFDAQDNPTGIKVLEQCTTPTPPAPEVDYFPDSVANVTLCLPNGAEEDGTLKGPTTVDV